MFSRRVFGGTPDTFKLILKYGPSSEEQLKPLAPVRLPKALVALDFDWNSDEAEPVVIERFIQKVSNVTLGRLGERLKLDIRTHSEGSGAILPALLVSISLRVAATKPMLREVQVLRMGSSQASQSLLYSLFKHLELGEVWKLRSAEGFGHFWSSCTEVGQWRSLRNLNLSNCGLTSLPSNIGELAPLVILFASHNKLTALPASVGALTQLEVLAVDHNMLTSVPVELRNCTSLRELNLEANRLSRLVLHLRELHQLSSLQLFGNPLEFLPELSPCPALRFFSLANVRISADEKFTKWEVDVTAQSYSSGRSHSLSALFDVIFRRSSLQHPLLAGALGRIAEDKSNCELIAREETALKQLILASLGEHPVVVQQACKTLTHLASDPVTALKLLAKNVLSAVMSMLNSSAQVSKVCGLSLLSALATGSDEVAVAANSHFMLTRLTHLACTGDEAVAQASLEALAALAACHANRISMRATAGLMEVLARLASQAGGHVRLVRGHLPGPPRGQRLMQLLAAKVLAVLGENDLLQSALGLPAISGRGVRIITFDGGGMKGLATVAILKHIEARLKGVLDLASAFDLYVGTSTGAVIAVSLAVLGHSLEDVEGTYTRLGTKVFNQAGAGSLASGEEGPPGWRESLYRMYCSSSSTIRVAVYGCKHDASTFEALLKDICDLKSRGCVSDQLIDTIALGSPKVAAVATNVTLTPATPFVFRNYELPPGSDALAASLRAYPGSSSHLVWQGIRASSAAPYYLDDFPCGAERFQDGAATANNPTLVAVQQARLLWPHLPIEAVVSIGTGVSPPKKRERGVSSMLDTGSVLIESACSTERIDEACATLLSLAPDVKYFRFNPMDERCGMELDDVNPASWASLMAACDEYCDKHAARLDELAVILFNRGKVEEDEAGSVSEQEAEAAPSSSIKHPKEEPHIRVPNEGIKVVLIEAPLDVLGGSALPSLSALTGSLASMLPSIIRLNLSTASLHTHHQPCQHTSHAQVLSVPAPPIPESDSLPSLPSLSNMRPHSADDAADVLREPLRSSIGELPLITSPQDLPDAQPSVPSIELAPTPRAPSMFDFLNFFPSRPMSAGSSTRGSAPDTPHVSTPQAVSADTPDAQAFKAGLTTPANLPVANLTRETMAGTNLLAVAVAAAAAESTQGAPQGHSAEDPRGLVRHSSPGIMQPSEVSNHTSTSRLAPIITHAHDSSTIAPPLASTTTSPQPPQPSPSDRVDVPGGATHTPNRAPFAHSSPVSPLARIAGVLQDTSGSAGIVHLSLTSADAGLVAGWKREEVALLEPGVQAEQLARQLLGLCPSTAPSTSTSPQEPPTNSHPPSIAEIFLYSSPAAVDANSSARCSGIWEPGRLAHWSMLARQEVNLPLGLASTSLNGVGDRSGPGLSSISSYLLQRAAPSTLLRPEDVLGMATEWSGRLVCSAAPLPPAITLALLHANAVAVIAPETLATSGIPWTLPAQQHRSLRHCNTMPAPHTYHTTSVGSEGESTPHSLANPNSRKGTFAGQNPMLASAVYGAKESPPTSEVVESKLTPCRPYGVVGPDMEFEKIPLDSPLLCLAQWFFAFYSALDRNCTGGVLPALDHADKACPQLAGYFVCYIL